MLVGSATAGAPWGREIPALGEEGRGNPAASQAIRRAPTEGTAMNVRGRSAGLGTTPAVAARLRAAHSRAVRQDVERPRPRRPQQEDPHRLNRERGTPQAVGLRPLRRPRARHLCPAAPVQHLVRRLQAARARAPGVHDRGMVARSPRLPADRHHQRRHAGHLSGDGGCRTRMGCRGGKQLTRAGWALRSGLGRR